jgi:hypothetical protein
LPQKKWRLVDIGIALTCEKLKQKLFRKSEDKLIERLINK